MSIVALDRRAYLQVNHVFINNEVEFTNLPVNQRIPRLKDVKNPVVQCRINQAHQYELIFIKIYFYRKIKKYDRNFQKTYK